MPEQELSGKSDGDALPPPWKIDNAHCWVWPGYYCQESCPFRHGSRSLFALVAPDRPKCALLSA